MLGGRCDAGDVRNCGRFKVRVDRAKRQRGLGNAYAGGAAGTPSTATVGNLVGTYKNSVDILSVQYTLGF